MHANVRVRESLRGCLGPGQSKGYSAELCCVNSTRQQACRDAEMKSCKIAKWEETPSENKEFWFTRSDGRV
jgi:hypothetical protein